MALLAPAGFDHPYRLDAFLNAVVPYKRGWLSAANVRSSGTGASTSLGRAAGICSFFLSVLLTQALAVCCAIAGSPGETNSEPTNGSSWQPRTNAATACTCHEVWPLQLDHAPLL